MVKDINIGEGSSNPCNFARMDSLIFFIANDGVHGYELWVTDATDDGTRMVKDISPASPDGMLYSSMQGFKFPQIQALGKKVYFFANDGQHGFELWSSDGTEVGTTLLKDIMPGTVSSSTSLALLKLGNLLLFPANDLLHGNEWWRTDGTDTGTYMLKDFYQGPSSSDPQCFFVDSNLIYYTGNNGKDGYGLCRTDGTAEGTVYIKNAAPTPVAGDTSPYIKYNNEIYFNGLTLINGAELWKTNGTTEGTQMVKEFREEAVSGSPSHFAVCRNKLVFSADNGDKGFELWASDGTGAGTYLVKDIIKGRTGSKPTSLTVLDTLLFFTATDSAGQVQLYISDLTDSNTHIFGDTSLNGIRFAEPTILFQADSSFYFSCSKPETGIELWVTNGSLKGTRMLPEICAGPCSSLPQNFYRNDTSLFLSAIDFKHGRELWQLNGKITILDQVTEPDRRDVYPDPLRKELYQLSRTGNDITYLKVFTLRGEELLTQDVKKPIPVTVASFEPGIYVLRAYDKNDRVVAFTRFVKP